MLDKLMFYTSNSLGLSFSPVEEWKRLQYKYSKIW